MGGLKFSVAQIVYPSIFLVLFISFLNFHFHILSFSPTLPTHQYETQIKNRGSLWKREEELAAARAAILEAGRRHSYMSRSIINRPNYQNETRFIPRGPIYRNPYAFHQSYVQMEKRFKIWVYREGNVPLFHLAPVKNIYSTEGHVIDELQSRSSSVVAAHPDEAHVFLLPVSVANIVHYLYGPSGDYHPGRLRRVVEDYVTVIANKYPYWNRSSGADHFIVSCHDWGPSATAGNRDLFKNMIRVLCNANTSEGFEPARDVTLPEIKVLPERLNPPDLEGRGKRVLAFFAGGAHGPIREALLSRWKGRGEEDKIRVYEYDLPKEENYFEVMASAKYCLCPSGYEVASPRLVEAMHVGCVPVIISEGYPPPLSDVLDWTTFSIYIHPSRIPEIKRILEAIDEDRYVEMLKRVAEVKRHFVMNRPPRPFDVLNMVFHSIWLRRLNLRLLPL